MSPADNPRNTEKYPLPDFLKGRIERSNYNRWLSRKASAHCKRDRSRVSYPVSREEYKQAIHRAVVTCGGVDWYTGEALNWEQISTYNNDASCDGRSTYKAGFALLPTVDHVASNDGRYEFVICSWRTNDCKNDLTLVDFVALCRRVIDKHGEELPTYRDGFASEVNRAQVPES